MAIDLALVQTKDQQTNQAQSNMRQALATLQSQPPLGGQTIKSFALASGSNTVPYSLNGRNLQGWIITRQRAQADIWDTQDSNANPRTTLLLSASAAVTVDIYVF